MLKNDIEWAKAYLGGVRALRYRLKYLNQKIGDLRDEILSRGSSVLGERVQTSAKGDALENAVIRYVDELTKLQKEYERQYIILQRRQDEAFDRIDKLKEGRQKDFLIRYYIDGVSEVEYANEAGFQDFGSVYHVKSRALNDFATMAKIRGWNKN